MTILHDGSVLTLDGVTTTDVTRSADPTDRSQPSILGPILDRFDEVLTTEALAFIRRLDDMFAGRRAELLARRRATRARINGGTEPDSLPGTASVRADPDWMVAPAPGDLQDRRVEITGPPTRRMMVHALRSGAQVWMADFEDASTPTWEAMIGGQLNLMDALDGRLWITSSDGEVIGVPTEHPTIVVRPRGWHLVEKHLVIDGRPVSATIVDAALYLFHCARRQIDAGSGPYLYLPKLENHLEARLWNDVLLAAQELLGLAPGTVRPCSSRPGPRRSRWTRSSSSCAITSVA